MPSHMGHPSQLPCSDSGTSKSCRSPSNTMTTEFVDSPARASSRAIRLACCRAAAASENASPRSSLNIDDRSGNENSSEALGSLDRVETFDETRAIATKYNNTKDRGSRKATRTGEKEVSTLPERCSGNCNEPVWFLRDE